MYIITTTLSFYFNHELHALGSAAFSARLCRLLPQGRKKGDSRLKELHEYIFRKKQKRPQISQMSQIFSSKDYAASGGFHRLVLYGTQSVKSKIIC